MNPSGEWDAAVFFALDAVRHIATSSSSGEKILARARGSPRRTRGAVPPAARLVSAMTASAGSGASSRPAPAIASAGDVAAGAPALVKPGVVSGSFDADEDGRSSPAIVLADSDDDGASATLRERRAEREIARSPRPSSTPPAASIDEGDVLRCAALVAEAEDDASAHSANLARLRASASATVGEVEDARVTHELKTRELDVARLKLRKLRADLESQNASEAYALAELELSNARCVAATREVQAELERIQLYVAVVRSSPLALMDPERRHFFYCDCHVGGLGRWFAECFSERPNWHPYPAQRWFLAPPAPGDDPASSADARQIYAPAGKVTVDYADQPSFSLHAGSCPGTDWLEDKARLARLIVPLGLTVPTWFVRDGRWVGEPAPATLGDDEKQRFWDHVWFAKESDKNFATGIVVRGTPEECVRDAMRVGDGKTWVIQPSVREPALDARGHKLGWRLYVACVSPPGTKALHWYVFCGGYLVAADGPFDDRDLSLLSQVTRDRVMRMNDWDGLEEHEPAMREKIEAMLCAAQPLMRPPETKACFELFGVDVAMSAAGDVWIIEVNRSPRVKLEDKPMMHALLNIAAPRYGLPQPGSVWDPLDVDPDATWGAATTPEAEAEEERTWGRRRWGPGGENGEKAQPGAFASEQANDWGARAEETR